MIPKKLEARRHAAAAHKQTTKTQQNKNMKTTKVIITALGALAIATTLGFAQDKHSGPPKGGRPGGPGNGQRPKPEAVFKKLDTNNDGALSLEEFKAGKRAQQDPTKAEGVFKQIDKNNDGQISLDEFKAHRPPGGPGGHGGPGNHAPGQPPQAPAGQ